MANKTWAMMMVGGWMAGLLTGCGGAAEDSLVEGPEEDITDGEAIGQVGEAIITGCAATVVTKEAHAGLFLQHTDPRTMYIQQLKWTLTNPTDTNCPFMTVGMYLRDEIDLTVLDTASLNSSLGPHKWRTFWWNIGYNSRKWWVNSLFIRNNVIAKTTYMPAYFNETGQIDH